MVSQPPTAAGSAILLKTGRQPRYSWIVSNDLAMQPAKATTTPNTTLLEGTLTFSLQAESRIESDLIHSKAQQKLN